MIARVFNFVVSPEFIAGAALTYVVMQRRRQDCPACGATVRQQASLQDDVTDLGSRFVEAQARVAADAVGQRVTKAATQHTRAFMAGLLPFEEPASQHRRPLAIVHLDELDHDD